MQTYDLSVLRCQATRKAFTYSMVLSIMANSTQSQENNAADANSANEEICSPQKQEIQATGEAETDPETENEVKSETEILDGGGGKEEEEKRSGGKEEEKENEEKEKRSVVKEEGIENGEKEEEKRVEIAEEEKRVEGVKEEKKVDVAKEEKRVEVTEKEKILEVTEEEKKVEVVKEEKIIKVAEEEKGVGKEGEEVVVSEEKREEKEKREADREKLEERELEERLDDRLGEEEEEEDYDGEEDEEEDDDEQADDEEGDLEDEKVPEGKPEKPLDHDQDRRNPQYIPKGGAFYEHDNRTSLEDVENKDPQEVEKKKKVWKESKESERWLHDWYKESEQTPKSKQEIIQIYGYDIRKEEAPPRARRRRKYGRGPDKYERNWEDEQAYMIKQNGPGRRGKKKSFGKDEFPPLPNQRKNDTSVEKAPPKSLSWKKPEEEPPRNRSPKVVNHEKQPPVGGQFSRNEQMPQRNSNLGVYSNKKSPVQVNRKINDEDIKPFRNDKNKWKSNNFRRGKQDEIPKPNKTKPPRQGEAQTPRSVDSNRNSSGDSDMMHLTEGFCQMTFHNKHSNMRDRPDSNEISEQEMDNPANRLNPKRYSRNRKSFTGFFPPEDIVEIDPADLEQQQQQQKSQHVNLPQQPLNIQSVIRRYPNTYNGNPGYMPTRAMMPGIPNQGVSPQSLQQALSPQGIPQQALSPQVPGLQTIELQQGPMPPQPNFVPPMYIDMDTHYGPSEMLGAYTGYAPYSASQPSEMYQPSGGITYYSTECQNSNQIRPPPARRQKAAIPIVPPPE